jgi:predicted nucleic acid-binding Zn ribbon protein
MAGWLWSQEGLHNTETDTCFCGELCLQLLLKKKRRKTKVMWEVNLLLSVSLLIDWSLAVNYEPLSGNS